MGLGPAKLEMEVLMLGSMPMGNVMAMANGGILINRNTGLRRM